MNEKISRYGVVAIVVITALSLIPLRSLKFEFNIEELFPKDDPELAFFRQFSEQFHSEIDDEFIFIVLKNRSGIFQQDFLQKADSLARFVSGLDHILKVYSLTGSHILYFSGNEINARPLIHIDSPAHYRSDSVYLFQSREFRDLLISRNGNSISIAAFNEQYLTDVQKDSLLIPIQRKIHELGFDETHLTAKIRIERVYVQEIKKNLVRYLALSLLLVSFSLFLLFRSIKTIFIPLLIILVSICWTLSLISLTGHSLDIISSLIPPILAAICMSDVIHISTHYVEKLRTGLPKQEALKKAYAEVGLATFYTCCTVATGFFTLGITDIIPIRNFGFYTGLGILLAFGITLISLFAFYSNSPVPGVASLPSGGNYWDRLLAGSFGFLLRNRLKVFLVAAVVLCVSLFFTTRIQINSSLLQEVPRNHPMLADFAFMEKEFWGTRPFELALESQNPDSSFLLPQKMKELEPLEKFLKDSCGIGQQISPLSLFRGANKSFHDGDNDWFRLPDSVYQAARLYEAIRQTEFAGELSHYLSEDGSRLRISGRLPNVTVQEFGKIKRKIDRFLSSGHNPRSFTWKITGSAELLDKITFSLTDNLFTGILLDIALMSFISILILRKWQIIFIALVPNLIPLVIMAGFMGALHINLKADTSVIFAIALGIVVDDTIHFLSRVRLEISRGLSLSYAVKRTYLSTGKAIVLTGFVLLSGFLILLSSSFGGTFYIGLLISLCLLFALLCDLTLTPLLILLFFPGKK